MSVEVLFIWRHGQLGSLTTEGDTVLYWGLLYHQILRKYIWTNDIQKPVAPNLSLTHTWKFVMASYSCILHMSIVSCSNISFKWWTAMKSNQFWSCTVSSLKLNLGSSILNHCSNFFLFNKLQCSLPRNWTYWNIFLAWNTLSYFCSMKVQYSAVMFLMDALHGYLPLWQATLESSSLMNHTKKSS